MYSNPFPPPPVSNRVFRPGDDDRLVPAAASEADPATPGPALTAIHAALKAFITHDAYPCAGAKAALNKNAYRLAHYSGLGEDHSIEDCTVDVQWFAQAAESIDDQSATFVAVFDDPTIRDEVDFENQLWKQLQGMHALDTRRYLWDPTVSCDPESPDFSFSIGGRAFFIVGMHPHAPREARRFPYPTLVFNLHAQFDRMREEGSFDRIKSAIREREQELEGSPNLLLTDHGERSEAMQYAGRRHQCPWKPPFTPDETADKGRRSRRNR